METPSYRDKGVYLWPQGRTEYVCIAKNHGYDLFEIDYVWKMGRPADLEIDVDGMVLLERKPIFHCSELGDTNKSVKTYHGYGLNVPLLGLLRLDIGATNVYTKVAAVLPKLVQYYCVILAKDKNPY